MKLVMYYVRGPFTEVQVLLCEAFTFYLLTLPILVRWWRNKKKRKTRVSQTALNNDLVVAVGWD